MNPPHALRRLFPLAAAAAMAWPAAARALFGVGDVVYDPANTAETINVLRQTEQEFDRLGSLLGVSTGQLDQLLLLAAAIGNSGEASAWASPPSLDLLAAKLRALSGLEDSDLEALFNSAGMLDAFLGLSPSEW